MLSPGDKIGHYEIIRLLGEGGMGQVYLAKDDILERQVAIKFLPEEMECDVQTRQRFEREAKSAAALDHPFICKVFETGESEGKSFIAMEYVEGKTLYEEMEEEPLSLRDTLRVALEIAEALDAAHKKRIIHRDLKPSNIMITPQGHAKVMDFGLAKRVLPGGEKELSHTLTKSSITAQGAIAGTISYMSPEQARGEEIDARSDIFSLGIILYEMLTGGHPFSKPSAIETLSSILRDSPPQTQVKPKSVNPIMAPIMSKALAKDASTRYQNVAELIIDLRKAQREIIGGPRLTRLLPMFGAGIIIVAVLVIVTLRFVLPGKTPMPETGPEPISVLIADVQNKTDDPVFDGVLESMLSLSLDGASYISVFENKQAHSKALDIRPESEGRINLELAQLICQSAGVNLAVNSTIEQRNGGYLITVRAIDPISSEEIAKVDQKISSKQDVFRAADLLSAKFQSKLVDIPDDSAEALMKETFTTTSLEAMKAYAEGQRLGISGKREEAIEAYQKAIEFDGEFGRAYAGLAVVYHSRGEYQLAEENFLKAMERIDQMTDREKYRTRGGYYLFKHDYQKAIEEFEALLKQFPRDAAGLSNLPLAYFLGYRMPEAFEIGLRAVELDPGLLNYRYNQSWYSLASGNFERAKEEVQKTLEIEPSYVKAFLVRALIELEEGQLEEAAAAYHHAEGLSSFGASQGAAGLMDLAVYEGRLRDAIPIAEKGISIDLENGWNYYAADKNLILANIYLMLGKQKQAAEAADRAVELNNREELKFAAARIHVQAGKEEKAEEIAKELGSKFQDIHLAYGKLIEGYICLKKDDATNALRFFDEAQSHMDTWLGRLAKGLAYLEADAFTQAYSEFEICVKRRGEAMSIFLNDVPTFRYLDSLYYYLGRAQEGLNSPAAKDSYKKFLKIKESADSENPLVEDARSRLNNFDS